MSQTINERRDPLHFSDAGTPAIDTKPTERSDAPLELGVPRILERGWATNPCSLAQVVHALNSFESLDRARSAAVEAEELVEVWRSKAHADIAFARCFDRMLDLQEFA